MVDCAKLYSVIAGPDMMEESRLSWYQPVVTVPKKILKSLCSIKIGVDYEWIKKAETEILMQFYDSLRKLERDGAELVAITITDPFNRDVAHPICFSSEMIPAVNDFLNDESPALGPGYYSSIHSVTTCSKAPFYPFRCKVNNAVGRRCQSLSVRTG